MQNRHQRINPSTTNEKKTNSINIQHKKIQNSIDFSHFFPQYTCTQDWKPQQENHHSFRLPVIFVVFKTVATRRVITSLIRNDQKCGAFEHVRRRQLYLQNLRPLELANGSSLRLIIHGVQIKFFDTSIFFISSVQCCDISVINSS